MTGFYDSLEDLDKVNWSAVEALDFRGSLTKEGKQAEFLVHEAFPWRLVEKIGVFDAATEARARAAIRGAAHQPAVLVKRMWYF